MASSCQILDVIIYIHIPTYIHVYMYVCMCNNYVMHISSFNKVKISVTDQKKTII